MLNFIGWTLKTVTFAALILVLANWIRWDGKTISDQVKTHMASAERSTPMRHAKRWFKDTEAASESVTRSERRKLRELIRQN